MEELCDCEVWSLAWAEDGEEAEACGGHVGEVVVCVRDEFAGFFRCGVWADGVVDVIGFAEGCFVLVAVDGAGGGDDESLCGLGVLCCSEEDLRACDVGVRVGCGVCDAWSDAGLCGEVDDGGWALFLEKFEHCARVGDVGVDELVAVGGVDCVCVGADVLCVLAFDGWVVEGFEVVEGDDGVAA